MLALAFTWDAQQDHERQSEVRDRDRIAARYVLCLEIEKLKKGERDRAIQQRKDLEKNLRLLNLKMTPAIREAATDAKFKTLQRHAPRKGGCAAFARDPSSLNIVVPHPKEK